MLKRIARDIDESEWFISAAHNLNYLHDYIKTHTKSLKVFIAGSGRMRKKFKKIIALYKANNIEEISKIKNRLIEKVANNSIVNLEKREELIMFCSFLEEYKEMDYITCARLTKSIQSSVDRRTEQGRQIHEIVGKMNDEKQEKSIRLSQKWLNRYSFNR